MNYVKILLKFFIVIVILITKINCTSNIKVSIVVPIINSEKYLNRCIQSVLNQSLKDIELIFINNELNNNSFDILNNYTKIDNRIKIYNISENKGLNYFRNVGIENAFGEFISFMDSDDYVDNKYFENLYNHSSNYDVVVSYFVHNTNYSNVFIYNMIFKKKGTIFDSIWRKEFIINHNIRFDISNGNDEDIQFRKDCYKFNAKILYLPDRGIYYYYKSGEFSRKFSRKYFNEKSIVKDNKEKKIQKKRKRNLRKKKNIERKIFYQDNRNNNNEFQFCDECINSKGIPENSCKKCSIEKLLGNIKIHSREDTLYKLIKEGGCISRYGDYEFNLIFGTNVNYQSTNVTLIDRLRKILISNKNRHLVGISNYINPYNQWEILHGNLWWYNYVENRKLKLIKYLDLKKEYYSANISRFYIELNDKSNVPIYVEKLKKLWDGRDLLIIEGEQTRLGVGNDLFDNAKSIQRILGPVKNAFSIYNKILNETLSFLKSEDKNKEKLILLAMGPTATVLAYDLCEEGYQAIDIGHVDIEYEWFIRKVNYKSPIEFKYVNEGYGGDVNINDNVQDQRYYKQIILVINEY